MTTADAINLTIGGGPAAQASPAEVFAAYHALLAAGGVVEEVPGGGGVILAVQPPPELPVTVHLIQELLPAGVLHLRVGSEIVGADPREPEGRRAIAQHYPWHQVGFSPIPAPLLPYIRGHAEVLPDLAPRAVLRGWRSMPPPTQVLLAKLGAIPEEEAQRVLNEYGVWP